MYPRISALSGPLQGSVFFIADDMDDDELTIGRSKSCDLTLDDPAVARRHCGITRLGDYVQIHDFITGFRLYINGFYYPGKALVHGDRIRVGHTIFVYLTLPDGEVDPAILKLTAAERAWEWEAQPGTHGWEAPKAVVVETLLQIGASINGLRDVDEIQSRVFEWIFRVIPVKSVAILLFGRGADSITTTTYRHAGSQSDEAFPIDESVTQQASRDGGRVCSGNVVCHQLTALGTRVGLLYIVMPTTGFESFMQAHSQLLESIAGSAAVALENARTVAWLESENRRLKQSIAVEHDMVGRSPRMLAVYELVGGAGPSELTILITGESGTGKELVAHAIHRNSPRSAKDFHAVNCSAFPETLLGSELFGHERGAFTGADRLRKGLFESAEGGTVFLDEIGDCPPKM
jgi:hypothetical protein